MKMSFLVRFSLRDPLTKAILLHDSEKVKDMLNDNPSLVNGGDEFNTYFVTAILQSTYNIMSLFYLRGVDVNNGGNGIKPIQAAVLKPCRLTCRILISRGANIDDAINFIPNLPSDTQNRIFQELSSYPIRN